MLFNTNNLPPNFIIFSVDNIMICLYLAELVEWKSKHDSLFMEFI
jgi:hypothetical protein